MKASVGGEVDWPSWALSVRGLSSTQRHVLRVLCELCDERGTLVISSRHLADRLCVHRATLFRALAFLETQGLIRREKQRDHSGGLIPTRFQLLRRVPAHRDTIPTPATSPASTASMSSRAAAVPSPAVSVSSSSSALQLVSATVPAPAASTTVPSSPVPSSRVSALASSVVSAPSSSGVGFRPVVVEWGDHEGLSVLIGVLESCGWGDEVARQVLAESVHLVASRWAQMVVSRVKGVLDGGVVCGEVAGVAWMCCRREASSLVNARRAWHLLTMMVIRHFTTEASQVVQLRSSFSSLSVEDISEWSVCAPVEALECGEGVVVGVEEVEDSPMLSRVRDGLVAAGLPFAIACAGVARAGSLAASVDETRVEAVAKRDAVFARLGLAPVATMMVALIRGRRRHLEEACVYLSDEDLAARCAAVVQALGVGEVS